MFQSSRDFSGSLRLGVRINLQVRTTADFILFSAKSERISLVRKGEIRKACFRIMRCGNMGKLWEELNTKRAQKEMLKMGKFEWEHKKSERMLKKKIKMGRKKGGERPQTGWSRPAQERLFLLKGRRELAKNNLLCCHAAIQERHRERERVEKEWEKRLRRYKKKKIHVCQRALSYFLLYPLLIHPPNSIFLHSAVSSDQN